MGGPGSPIPGRMFLDQSHARFSSLDECSSSGRHRTSSDVSPGRSPGHIPAYTRAFQSTDAQALQLQFQQTKQLRQQKLLSQVEAVLASANNNNNVNNNNNNNSCVNPTQASVPASSPQRSPCTQIYLQQEEPQAGPTSPSTDPQHRQQGLLRTYRSNSDRDQPCPQLSPRIPAREQFRNLSLDNLESSPSSHRPIGRGYLRNSPSPSSILIQTMRDTGAGSNTSVGGSPANLSPSPPLKTTLQYE
ncbi:hypothetical protein EGW08_006993, partial [Elysia chlorotica]